MRSPGERGGLARHCRAAPRIAADGNSVTAGTNDDADDANSPAYREWRAELIGDAEARIEALAEIVASPIVRKAIDANDEQVTESVRRHAKEERERLDSLGIMRIELLVIADQAYALSRKTVDLMRAGAMEAVPDDVRQEIADTHRKIADTHRWAAELCESGVRATDEALDEWLDQPGGDIA